VATPEGWYKTRLWSWTFTIKDENNWKKWT
jgi:hypothetical protein